MEIKLRCSSGRSKKLLKDNNVCYSVYSPVDYYIASGDRVSLDTGLVIDSTNCSAYIRTVNIDHLVLKKIDIVTQVLEIVKGNNIKIIIQNNSPEHFLIKDGDIICKFIFDSPIEPKISYD